MTSLQIQYSSCPLCSTEGQTHIATGNITKHALYQDFLPPEIKWFRCAACDHVFTEGYWTDEAQAKIFQRTHDNQKVGAGAEQMRVISARMVEAVIEHSPINKVERIGAWLDVGFGNASLLLTAKEFGFDVVGLDSRPQSVEDLQSLNIQASTELLTFHKSPRAYSVISLADCLEHVPFPTEYLRAADRLLASDGVLFLSMPNLESPLWTILDNQRANPYWSELEHFHNFSKTRLCSLLDETGFVPVHFGVSERYRVCMEIIARKK